MLYGAIAEIVFVVCCGQTVKFKKKIIYLSLENCIILVQS